MHGEYVKFPANPADFVPRKFADYHLYVFEHAFDTKIENAVMTFIYELQEFEACTVCGTPTYNYYLEPLCSDESGDAILYAVCDDCFDYTHLADMPGVDDD